MALTLNAYQQAAHTTARNVLSEHPLLYPTLGLTNEAGEFAGKVKKIYRDQGSVLGDSERAALAAELGDVLWYLAELSTVLGMELEDVAQANLDKLRSRQARGVLGGAGDER